MAVTIYPMAGDPILVSTATSVQAGTFVPNSTGGATSVDLYNDQNELVSSFGRDAIIGYVIGPADGPSSGLADH